jgi:hypothetical protein
MIRIDEIYNNTFWPWLTKYKPGTRMIFCDTPGSTSPDTIFNLIDNSTKETDYVFFHDQEPVWLDLHKPLFNEVLFRTLNLSNINTTFNPDTLNLILQQNLTQNTDIFFRQNSDLWEEFKHTNKKHFKGHVVVSEHGQYVKQMCDQYGWQPHYYFYHGWACQDWFRGYDRTFLIPRACDRTPTKTFISPNRIIAGKRDHRVLFLYNVFQQNLDHNWISAPRICQYENVDIIDIANKYNNIYPDIEQVFLHASLPKLFPGETTQQMTSCWLTNFDEAADSLIYVPTETVYFGNRLHITEKTFKAIALEMPFVLVAPAHSLEYLRSYGFKTFAGILDESYDNEIDDTKRIEKVVSLLKQLDELSTVERYQIHRACLPIVEHNYNHFYKGGFTNNYLWPELTNMLDGLK